MLLGPFKVFTGSTWPLLGPLRLEKERGRRNKGAGEAEGPEKESRVPNSRFTQSVNQVGQSSFPSLRTSSITFDWLKRTRLTSLIGCGAGDEM
jgi:hypothetical protein